MDPLWLNENNITANILSNSSEDNYSSRLEALDPPMRVFLVCLYSMTSCFAFIGNVLVIIVEIFGKRSALNLRKFLINLAISDILLGVFSVPFTYTDFMLGRWIFPYWLCPFTQFILLLTVFVTSYTLTVIGIERYLAMLYPLSSKNQWFTCNCNLILSIGWIIGGSIANIGMIHTTTVPFKWDNVTYYDCRGPDMRDLHLKVYITSIFILTFAFPLLIQSYSYASIGRKLLRDKLINNKLPLRRTASSHDRDMAKIMRMLVAVVIIFSICWLPIKCFMLLLVYWPDIIDLTNSRSYYVYISSFFFCHWLAMSNSFVNPIIYSFMSRSFRADLQDLISNIWPKFGLKNVHKIQGTTTERKSELKELTVYVRP